MNTPKRPEANEDMFAPDASSLPTDEQMTPEYQAFINGSMPLSAITLREHFAAAAMEGLCANPAFLANTTDLAKRAVAQADALLLALQKEPGQ